MFKTKYPEADMLINEFLGLIQEVFGSNLKGLYLFGSLVGGDFDEKVSDIDLLAIVDHIVTDKELAQLKNVHATFTNNHPEWYDRLEVAYVSIDGMKNFKTNTNKIARISPGEPLHFRDMNKDWLMDWYMVQEQCITVFGQSPETYIPHITTKEYIQSIRDILPAHEASATQARHKGYQAYIVMSFCRNLYAIKHGKQVSKIAGTHWAARQYPPWADFINEAASWRGSADKSDSPKTQQQTIKFAKFAMDESKKL